MTSPLFLWLLLPPLLFPRVASPPSPGRLSSFFGSFLSSFLSSFLGSFLGVARFLGSAHFLDSACFLDSDCFLCSFCFLPLLLLLPSFAPFTAPFTSFLGSICLLPRLGLHLSLARLASFLGWLASFLNSADLRF